MKAFAILLVSLPLILALACGGGGGPSHSGNVGESPVAAADTYHALENTTLEVSVDDGVLSNDYDPDNIGTDIVAVLYDDASNGILAFETDGSFSYIADEGFTGTDTFTYIATDALAQSDAVTVTILVLDPEDYFDNARAEKRDEFEESELAYDASIAPDGDLLSDEHTDNFTDFFLQYVSDFVASFVGGISALREKRAVDTADMQVLLETYHQDDRTYADSYATEHLQDQIGFDAVIVGDVITRIQDGVDDIYAVGSLQLDEQDDE